METFCGIDWADDHHDVALIDRNGQLLGYCRIGDDHAGWQELLQLLAEHGDTAEQPIPVAIETSHGLLVAALRLTRPVYAINPLAASRYRTRTALSGKKSDRADAVMLANILRTDQHVHRPLPAARDRALLVLGFYGALRRSELVGLDTGDVEVNDQGLVVTLRRSKTDQDAAGRRIAMLHTGSADSCPAEVYLAWLTALDQALANEHLPLEGDRQQVEERGRLASPVFRPVNRHGSPAPARLTDKAVARVVQRTALRAGLGNLDLAGHSLRAGFATTAAAAGKSERAIMKQTGHKSLPMVRRYIREGSLFRDNATDGIVL